MSKQEDHIDIARTLAEQRRMRQEADIEHNLHLVAAALQDRELSMRERRQRAELMARNALRRLRQKH